MISDNTLAEAGKSIGRIILIVIGEEILFLLLMGTIQFAMKISFWLLSLSISLVATCIYLIFAGLLLVLFPYREIIGFYQSFTSDTRRNIELTSLFFSAIIYPAFFILGGVGLMFFPFKNPYVTILGGFFCVIFGLVWDTRYSVGGIMIIAPLRSYLNNTESEDDCTKAKFSYAFSLIFLFFFVVNIVYFL